MNLKEHLNDLSFEVLRESAESLDMRAFVIGGFVRDILLKRKTKFDIDVVTEGSGIKLAEEVARHKEAGKLNVFKNFGTAMVKFGQTDLEFVLIHVMHLLQDMN